MSNVQVGVSIYSYTQEFAKNEYDLEKCIEQAASHGAKTIEIVGSQMLKSYPNISDEEALYIKEICKKFEVTLVSYGANSDRGLRSDRDLSEDELFHSACIDLQTAHKLGCKVMRAQFLITPEVFERIAPYAEAYKIKVGIEIHNPETPSSNIVQQYLEVIKKTGSKYLGLIPDFGCFAVKPNKPHWENALKNGGRKEVLELAAKLRYDNVDRNQAMQVMIKAEANSAEMLAFQGMYGFVTFYTHPDFDGLKEILPYCVHFHGKFHYISESLEEASIPYPEIIRIIHESDFDGCIVAEYEDQSGPSDIMVSRYMKLMHKILEELE